MPRQRTSTEKSVSRTMSVGRESVDAGDAVGAGKVGDDGGGGDVGGEVVRKEEERGGDGREEREACSCAE